MISLKAGGWTQPMENNQVYFRGSKRNNSGSDGRPTVKWFLVSHTIQEPPQHLFLVPTSVPSPLFSALITTGYSRVCSHSKKSLGDLPAASTAQQSHWNTKKWQIGHFQFRCWDPDYIQNFQGFPICLINLKLIRLSLASVWKPLFSLALTNAILPHLYPFIMIIFLACHLIMPWP